jgi:signal transduction histidine kinase
MSRSERQIEPERPEFPDDGPIRRELSALRDRLAGVAEAAELKQEAERRRIARDLHDGLGQYFTVMNLELDALQRRGDLPAEAVAAIRRMANLSESTGRDVERIAWEIRPQQIGPDGFAAAVRGLLDAWSIRTQLRFDSHVVLRGRPLPPAVEATLFRILQEAVRNIVKHAGATRAGVVLWADDREVSLTIEDDGTGFEHPLGTPVDADGQDGLGMTGMRERLDLIGGKLELETSPGRGTTLLIHVPLSR